MVKPKGIWLQTTELTEIQEAQVVRDTVSVDAKQQPVSPRAGGKNPLLIGALSICCCALLFLVGLHVYPTLFPQTTAQAGAADEPVFLNILQPSYNVIIEADGREYITESRNQTVAQALHQVGVELGVQDEVSLPLDMVIENNATISVSRLYTRTETETKEIAPSRSVVDDATLPAGVSKVLEEGEPGLLENIYDVSYRDGEEIERVVVASNVVREPGTTTVAQGTTLASRSGSGIDSSEPSTVEVNGTELAYSRMLSVESTAYTWTGNTTATGTWPAKGTVAVDPRVIPLGSKLYVEGYGFATAADTGGAIKGNIIDVYFSSYDECVQWGRKRGITVYILE